MAAARTPRAGSRGRSGPHQGGGTLARRKRTTSCATSASGRSPARCRRTGPSCARTATSRSASCACSVRRTQRRLSLDVKVDGEDGSALGVMSQGELNCLALSLFLPRASMPESPFRFRRHRRPGPGDGSRKGGRARHRCSRALRRNGRSSCSRTTRASPMRCARSTSPRRSSRWCGASSRSWSCAASRIRCSATSRMRSRSR